MMICMITYHHICLTKIEITTIYASTHIIKMLIPDLFNALFDQANYHDLMVLRSLSKRQTKYANKYSVISQYNNLNMRKCDADTVSLFREIIENGCNLGRVKYLVNIGANIHVRGDYNTMALICKNGCLKTLKYTIQHFLQNEWSMFMFKYEKFFSHLEIVKYLASITDVCVTLLYSNDALQCGALYGNVEIVKYLMSIGADIHANRDWALQLSAMKGHIDVVKYLVSNGADIRRWDDYPLHAAAKNGHLDIVKYLISVGANLHSRNGEIFQTKLFIDYPDCLQHI